MSFDFRYPTPLPSTKGWGPGYPDCQRDMIVPVAPFAGGVHKGIAELVALLAVEMAHNGLDYLVPGCWGFGCRGTKSSSGSGTVTPSFHSWGLALDINAPRNVFGAAEPTSEIATTKRWVVPFLTSYGFFWLGPSIKDWMHFSFVGSTQDAKDMTAKARREIGDDMGALDDYLDGGRMKRKGEPLPANANKYVREGYNEATRILEAAKTPKPGIPGPHDHNLIGKAE